MSQLDIFGGETRDPRRATPLLSEQVLVLNEIAIRGRVTHEDALELAEGHVEAIKGLYASGLIRWVDGAWRRA